ncbi:MAG: tRNA (cytidine(34)-2'-O)-methyltransferase [Deltaproteobacteria bacterium]|nr:tRNA (cytidine(34)-2'-O)-methyltransferase [Deltaproteobacteria bacterium]
MQIILYHPEIPPNTGSIARLCAAAKVRLHLIEPLGFSLEDKYLRRAGLDYWPQVDLAVWPDWESLFCALGSEGRIVAASARQGQAYHRFRFRAEDCIVLGPESKGLPESVVSSAHACVRIPILGQVRSLNLACAASILLFEGLRQTAGLGE